MKRQRRVCKWCVDSCRACCAPRPVLTATHVAKWPRLESGGKVLIQPTKYYVCERHAGRSSQPREVKVYPLRGSR